jgi:competence protein ComGF
MSQKNILIIIIIIAVIALGAYFVLISMSPSVSLEEEKIPETEIPESEQFEEISSEEEPGEQELLGSLEYKIINQGQITETAEGAVSEKKMVYDVVAGKISEETVKALAERIIAEVTLEDEEIDSIVLNFYEDEGSVEGMEIDVAVVNWIPNKISVKMIKD